MLSFRNNSWRLDSRAFCTVDIRLSLTLTMCFLSVDSEPVNCQLHSWHSTFTHFNYVFFKCRLGTCFTFFLRFFWCLPCSQATLMCWTVASTTATYHCQVKVLFLKYWVLLDGNWNYVHKKMSDSNKFYSVIFYINSLALTSDCVVKSTNAPQNICQPTNDQQADDKRPTVGWQTANSRPADGPQPADKQPTVGRCFTVSFASFQIKTSEDCLWSVS